MSAPAASPPPALPPLDAFIEVLPVPPQQERRRGIVRFVGLTDFAEGEWVGVELVGSDGRNDGSVKGQVYFKCLPGQGVFVRPNLVVPYGSVTSQETAKAMEPLREKVAELERQLAAALQSREEATHANGQLREELHRAHEELSKATAAAAAQRAADDDDDLAVQVRMEEERLALQQQLTACQVKLHAAETAGQKAEAELAAAQARERDAAAVQQQSKEAQTRLRERVDGLQRELADAHAEVAKAVAQAQTLQAQQQQQQQRSASTAQEALAAATAQTEVTALRSELKKRSDDMEQLRREHSELATAHAALTSQLGAEKERAAAADSRAEAAERHLAETQLRDTAEKAEANTLHSKSVAELRAELELAKREQTRKDAAHTAELDALRESLAKEQKSAVESQRAASDAALSALQHEKTELQELCQLLEDELKEEKGQSDALAQVVEQLGAEKAAAEAAVDSAQQPLAQERDRLRRDLEEARAREVQWKTAAEDAQRERAEALRRLDEGNPRVVRTVGGAGEQKMSKASPPGGTSAAAASSAGVENVPHSASAAALQKCQNDLDEAQVRIMQLTSAQHVADELQRRCEELTRSLQQQRQDAQKREEALQRRAESAEKKGAEEVALWKRQCVAAQRASVDLGNTVAQLQQSSKGGAAGSSTAPLAVSAGLGLDAARERRYETTIASLTQQLMASQSARISALATALTQTATTAPTPFSLGSPRFDALRSPVKLLDFSSPATCKASTQSLFHSSS